MHPPMMCSVCKYGLTRLDASIFVTWHHPSGIVQNHDPVPVPTDYALLRGVCDFCSGPDPIIEYTTAVPANITYTAGGGAEVVSFDEQHVGRWQGRQRRVSTREGRRGSFGATPQSETSIEQTTDNRWAACAGCAPLVEANDTWGLVTRATAVLKLSAKKLVAERARFAANIQITLDAIVPGSGCLLKSTKG